MEFWLQQNSDKFQLPVKPSDYTVSVSVSYTHLDVYKRQISILDAIEDVDIFINKD